MRAEGACSPQLGRRLSYMAAMEMAQRPLESSITVSNRPESQHTKEIPVYCSTAHNS